MDKLKRKWTLGHYHWVSDGLDWYVGWHKDSTRAQRANKCLSLLGDYDIELYKQVKKECTTDEQLIEWFSNIGIYLGDKV